MGFRKNTFVLVSVVSLFVVGAPALAQAAASGGWHTVTYDGVSLRAPAAWPVLNLSAQPSACPMLDVHAVYLGTPGPQSSCPAAAQGKTEAAWIQRANPASPDAREATANVTIGGLPARTNPDYGITHTITDILPAAGVEVSLTYGSDPALARRRPAGPPGLPCWPGRWRRRQPRRGSRPTRAADSTPAPRPRPAP